MKRKLCLAMSVMLAAGALPAYAAEREFEEITDTYTAEVGTTCFTKNGARQPLDAEIYIKEDYVMLPLRTFMLAVDPDAKMEWDDTEKKVQVELESEEIIFDIGNNQILIYNKPLKVYGEMEISQNRIFVPIRNWKNILEAFDYTVDKDDLKWDESTKTAAVIVSKEIAVEKEKGDYDYNKLNEKTIYTLDLSNKYDEIENIGDGFFIAEKYMEDNIGLGQGIGSSENEYYLIDSTGKVYLKYESNSIRNLQSLNDGLFLVRSKDRSKFDQVIDKNGTVIFESPYDSINPFYEGLAQVSSDSFSGFVDKNGNPVITLQFEYAENFSEGFAAICVGMDSEEDTAKWNYVNKNGKYINGKEYQNCQSFSDGMGRIITRDGVGYIDKAGNEIIKPQYKWGSAFKNGGAYVLEKDSNEVWLIDKTGKKLKSITKPDKDAYISVDENSHILVIEEIVELPDGDHKHVQTYYDAYGEVSQDNYRIRKTYSEGLSPTYNEKTKKYGYSSNGYWEIAPLFDEADPFRDGYAVVRNAIELSNGEEDVDWGIIKMPK